MSVRILLCEKDFAVSMSLPKPCLGVGGQRCPHRGLTTHSSGRCEPCRRQYWQSRGSTTQRGYGAQHRALRAAWEPIVAAGQVICWRCGELIQPGEPWDLGHDDSDRTQWRSPEHVACNRATNRKQR